MSSLARRAGARLLLALGLLLALQALWLPAKALLAQRLLDRAFEQSPGQARPWPGADFAAVARLSAPRLQVSQIVLDQASGRALAFGPGMSAGALPASLRGRIVLAGHRDSHFEWLRELRVGDVLELDTGSGRRGYQVSESSIVDTRYQALRRAPPGEGGDELWLTTCWPFDSLAAGGPLRLAVRATAVQGG